MAFFLLVLCPHFWFCTINACKQFGSVLEWRQFIKEFWKLLLGKVEKILKGSLDSPSFSVKIQIMGRKVCLRCKFKALLRVVNITQQCFALLRQVNIPAKNLNFLWRWRWWDQIQAIFLKLFYFTKDLESLGQLVLV